MEGKQSESRVHIFSITTMVVRRIPIPPSRRRKPPNKTTIKPYHLFPFTWWQMMISLSSLIAIAWISSISIRLCSSPPDLVPVEEQADDGTYCSFFRYATYRSTQCSSLDLILQFARYGLCRILHRQ